MDAMGIVSVRVVLATSTLRSVDDGKGYNLGRLEQLGRTFTLTYIHSSYNTQNQ